MTLDKSNVNGTTSRTSHTSNSPAEGGRPRKPQYITKDKDATPTIQPGQTWIPNDLWQARISDGARVLYINLLMHEQEGSQLPDNAELARRIGRTTRTIQKYFRELREQGLIVFAPLAREQEAEAEEVEKP